MRSLDFPHYNDLFRAYCWFPLPDSGLCKLLERAEMALGLDTLVSYIQKVAITDSQPVYHIDNIPGQFTADCGSRRAEYWHHLRRDLAVIPSFHESGRKAGLTKRQCGQLLLGVAAHASEHAMFDLTAKIENVRDILAQVPPRDAQSTYRGLSNLLKRSREDKSLGRASAIVKMGLAAGMSLDQSLDIVNTIYDRASIPEYVFMHLYDELHAMATNTAGGDVLHAALKASLGENPNRDANFVMLTKLAYMAVTQTPYALHDVFAKIAQPFRRRKIGYISHETRLKVASKALFAKTKTNEFQKAPEAYFPYLNKPRLINGVFPYCMSRPFAEGLSDLHQLMKTEYAEGGFIFDPLRGIWYSFGGRTEAKSGRVRHEHYPYDVARLSSNPVFVHIHPENMETYITPSCETLAFPQLQVKLTKLMAALPSVADWNWMASIMEESTGPINLSSFIVTSSGVTKMEFPQDPKVIREFAETYGSLRDQSLLEFDAQKYLWEKGVNDDYTGFVKSVLPVINNKLPEGFGIKQFQHDCPQFLATHHPSLIPF